MILHNREHFGYMGRFFLQALDRPHDLWMLSVKEKGGREKHQGRVVELFMRSSVDAI